MIKGCDLAVFQGPPQAWRKEAGRISWAGVKISELEPGGSKYVNPDAAADWRYLREHGKGRVAYLFAHPSTSVTDSVAFFAETLDALGLEPGDGIALDHETTDGLAPAAVAAWGLAVLNALAERFHRTPMLYTYRDFAAEGNCAGMGHFPLWISDPDHPAGHPEVPSPFTSWEAHQYSIEGAIDRDVAVWPTLKAMRTALGEHSGKVMHWHTLGRWSLSREAVEHGTTPGEMLRLARAAGHEYGPAMASYISERDYDARLPTGTELFAPAS